MTGEARENLRWETDTVEQDRTGDIFYMSSAGFMYYDHSDRTSTYMDTNTNYAVFNDGGLIQSGNIKKEEEEARKQATLQSILNGTYVPEIDIDPDLDFSIDFAYPEAP